MTRLIDDDELKNDFSEKICDKFDRWNKTITVAEFETFVRDVIDNASTIISCKGCKNNGNERMCSDCFDYSNFVWYEKRLQGEWIYHDKLNMYYCKDCGLLEPFTKEEIEEGIKLPNFCQQCGADMRGGKT